MAYEKFSQSYYWLTSLSIIIFNALFYMIVEPMVQLIGLHKKTDVIRLAAYTTVSCLVVDMVLLPVMIGMNLVEVSDNRISTSVFRGKYTDFSEAWYPDIGRQLLTTMILFTFQPLIDFLLEYLI